jgi:itaconate CoA-transferase
MDRQLYPLQGIKVVSLEQAVAAPFATARLADAGATVTKIERPEGDFARGYDQAAAGLSSYFVWLNRGKSSLALDLNDPKDRSVLADEVSKADIFVQNLKAGAAKRLGFGSQELRAQHPRLICCSISGFDSEGRLAERKAYDLLIQAESGLCSITGGPETPSRVGVSIVDIATGATAHAAMLEALIARERSGDGSSIRISMFDVMAEWMTVPLLNHEAGRTPQRIGMAHPSIAPYGVFETEDGTPILISIQSEREWQALCNGVLECPDAVTDPRTSLNVERVKNREWTDHLISRAFARLGTGEALEKLENNAIAFARLNDMNGLSTHPELKRITVATENGPVSYPEPAPIFSGKHRKLGPVPAIGQTRQTTDEDGNGE